MNGVAFKNGEYYHVYNRGVDKREIFGNTNDYFRFLKSLKEFNQIEPVVSLYIKDRVTDVAVRPLQKLQKNKLVEIIAYCLNPNHYHLILKQIKEGGISEFMKRLNGGYTGYFNFKNKRSGSLFQGKFKAIHIDTNEYLLYLSAYVNANHKIHFKNSRKWIFSSMTEYLSNRKKFLCNPSIIINQFESLKDYANFVKINAKAINERREEIKKYLIEDF